MNNANRRMEILRKPKMNAKDKNHCNKSDFDGFIRRLNSYTAKEIPELENRSEKHRKHF